jgi:transcriptional regulator with XRE-family HTH domain
MQNRLRDKLRDHRKKMGLSLDELATRTGSSKSYLWELENRDTSKPSAEKLTKIATALGVTAEYLLDEGAGLDDQHVKEAFFRKFSSLSADDQDRIRDMINTWGQKK